MGGGAVMLLTIDVGNTQTVIGVYDGGGLVHMWRIATNTGYTSDELRIKVRALFDADGIDASGVKGAILASVVPPMTHNWEKVICRSFGVDAVVVGVDNCRHLLGLGENEFSELGADRVADAVAAKNKFGYPVIVVDFGTATNIEVVDKDGVFRGGIIAPGVETSMRTLVTRAALLCSVELEDPGVSIGRNTSEAIQVGVAVGEAARIDGLVERIQEELGYPCRVVATGGLAHRIAPMSHTIDEISLELTLEGLHIIHEDLVHER